MSEADDPPPTTAQFFWVARLVPGIAPLLASGHPARRLEEFWKVYGKT